MIEKVEAIENLEAILAVDGVDMIQFGPSDYSVTKGLYADPEQSELLVAPVSDKAQAPRWVGELPPVPKAIGRDIGRLRQLIADDLQLFEGEANATIHPQAIDTEGIFAERDSVLSEHPFDAVSYTHLTLPTIRLV